MLNRKVLYLSLIFIPMLFGIVIIPSFHSLPSSSNGVRVVDLGNGTTVEVGPDEVLHTYSLSDIPTEMTGTGDPLVGAEYGSRTDSFSDNQMYYDSGSSTIQTSNLSVPLGEDWEGHEVFANVTSITENRTWVANSGFDSADNWTFTYHNEPKTYPSAEDNSFVSEWRADGHGSGDGSTFHEITGYYYDAGGGLYGDWYDPGDKAYAVQNLTIDRGDVTWLGVSLDYWANCGGWGGYMTGFFELFVSIGDPDNGGSYLWDIQFDAIQDDEVWYSTGFVEADPSAISLPNVSVWAGLRVATLEWYRPDINPEGRLDNILIYVKAKATPEEVNLQMNGVDVQNVVQGTTPLWGLGTVSYTPSSPWTAGAGYANFSWTPTPNPPDPDFDINVDIDVDVTLFARRYNVDTIHDTETFLTGDNYAVSNATDGRWETNFYAAVPGGYSSDYFYNLTLPSNRDIDHVSEPTFRFTNLTNGWTLGDPGDLSVNVSVFQITQDSQNGFWFLKGSSPNIIDALEVWDGSQWVSTNTFRADEDTRFRATLSTIYEDDIVDFSVYDSSSNVWTTLQAVVDSSGYAITPYVNLDAVNASVGEWEVQAFVNDSVSASSTHNIGFYRRGFSIEHSTDMSVKYPVGSETSWTKNVTYGELLLLQFRVNDSDNGDLLPGGSMTYSWDAGSGAVNDLGTGEYSVTLDTNDLSGNGQVVVDLTWTKGYYDSLFRTFTINVIYTTELLSSDAPGVDVPSGYDAVLDVYYEDQNSVPIESASVTCNWTLDDYTVTPVGGSPGHYEIRLETDAVELDTYVVRITSAKDFYETREIFLSVQVRELHTSAIPSTSLLSLPVGYSTAFTITYTDTDNNQPISGAANAISCNWSDIHQSGDLNYTVIESATPGIYNVTLYSKDTDVLETYAVVFDVEMFGTQNHTFTVTVELRTHLTSFYLVNPLDPTPYTDDIEVVVVYFDVDQDTGIENGSSVGYNVLIEVESDTLPSVEYTYANGSTPGEYIIYITASQWGTIGEQNLTISANWIGPTVKYSNETINTRVRIIETPTDIFLGDSPIITPYGENITFSVIYYDVGAETGVVNGTGIYAGNVHLTVIVLTAGETLTQDDMVITEVSFTTDPGEYSIEFNTTFLSGLVECDLRVWVNWTAGALPYYQNQTLLVSVRSTQRQTTVEWEPLPVTPYDELVNFTLSYRDVLSATVILDSPQLTISIQEAISYTVYYLGDATGEFEIEIDSASWTPGSYVFHLDVVWTGAPFYQNRTSIAIPISVRERHSDLTHGSYAPVQYGNIFTLNLTYRDLDDFSTSGMNGGTLTLDSVLSGFYGVTDNGDGTYTLDLQTDAPFFTSLGVYIINATIQYGGSRYVADAADFFYLTINERVTQLTSDLPELAPFLTQANFTIHYIDDSTSTGITGADVYASCDTAAEALQLGVNYFIDDLGGGSYRVRISTVALGTFGSYSIDVTVNWTGIPFYMERFRSVDIEVSRRPVSLTVTKSPLNTQFLENATFEITLSDSLNGSLVSLTKSVLILTHGGGTSIDNSQYSLTPDNGAYTISINSTTMVLAPASDHSITIKFFWGDMAPFYSNQTTSTKVTITTRATQAAVLSTPGAFYFFNITAILEYTDYLSGVGITGATLTVECLNTTTQNWILEQGNGVYEIRVNTTPLVQLGRYFFKANFSWTGQPYYKEVIGVEFSIIVNPVSTTLNFELPQDVTYYLGDTIDANITYLTIEGQRGIESAVVQTNWFELYGTSYTLLETGDGIYSLQISTSGLDAQLYSFFINASKYLHQNHTITADIILAAIPVEIDLEFSPTDPEWGDTIDFQANVTNALTGLPIIGADVNLTIASLMYNMADIGGGLYNLTLSTTDFPSGEYTLEVKSALLNHETRQRDFQIRVDKIAATIDGAISPQITVNGATVDIEVDYLIQSNSSAISLGTVIYSWIGGSGSLTWSSGDSKYIGQFVVADADVGTHDILIQASSANYKSVSGQVTIEIREITTEVLPFDGKTVLSAIVGDEFNVTVFLNNTDLDAPIEGATLSYSIGSVIGNLTDSGWGYYTALVPSQTLEIRDYILTVSSVAAGYTPSSMQFSVSIERIPTAIIITSGALIDAYYGTNATFTFNFTDTHNDVGIEGAEGRYLFGAVPGIIIDNGNGTYSMTINTTQVAAGTIAHTISVSFQKVKYEIAFNEVKLRVNPIPTEVGGEEAITVPYGDDFRNLFSFRDSLSNLMITDAIVVAVWEFGTDPLSNIGNGSYAFGFDEANLTEALPIREEPYSIRLTFTKTNYSRGELVVLITVREIYTEVFFEILQPSVFTGTVFQVRVNWNDIDHNIGIANALNSTGDFAPISEQSADYGNGTYVFAFLAPGVGAHKIEIQLSRLNYQTGVAEVNFISEISPEQQALVTTFGISAVGFLIIAALAALYIRVLSVPKMLRWIRSMVSALSKGHIPAPAEVRTRREVLLETMNEDLLPVNIIKDLEDVSLSTVDVTVLDVEELLTELAEVVGLLESDIDTLRVDLDKMRPSERAGFLREVIKQERSRRAREIAEAEAVVSEEVTVEDVERKLSEEELKHLKERLLEMGIEESEADLMVEQARNLSKAEIDALLEQIGGETE